jgi:zinc protease
MAVAIHRGLSPVRAVLDNGAVVIAKQSRATPAVTINAAFAAGSLFDPSHQPGLAHFVSRTIDRGTVGRSAEAIAEELDRRGVSLSTAINRHVLSVVCTCLVDDLDAVLGIVADIAMRPVFPENEIATRRSEVITLIRQDDDNPAVAAGEALLADLYGRSHGYGRRPRGTVDSVEAIDRAALQAFHTARFAPPALSLVMVGDIEPSRAIETARASFSRWHAAAPSASDLEAVPRASSRRVRVVPMMNKAQADIAYGFTSIRRADADYYAYWLMNNILGQYSIGGRLGDRIREREGMAYYVFSALDANVIPGPLTVRAGVSPANVDRAIDAIDDELSRFANEGPTEAEMIESRQYLIGSMPRTLETNAGIAVFLQTEEFFGLGLDYDIRVPDLLMAVTRDEVHEAARRALDPANATVVVAGPYTGQPG